MADMPCLEPGCTAAGIFPGSRTDDDGTTVHGSWCLDHPGDGLTAASAELIAMPVDAEEGYHPDVTAGLAAMVLEHTAMSTLSGDDATGDAMRSLSKLTGMTLDVCAGILLATTAIMAAGDVSADELTALAEVFETVVGDDNDGQADDDVTAVGPDDDRDGMSATCPECDGTGKIVGYEEGEEEDCPTCDGRGVVDPPAGPDDLLAAWNDGTDLPTSDEPGKPTTPTESETNESSSSTEHEAAI